MTEDKLDFIAEQHSLTYNSRNTNEFYRAKWNFVAGFNQAEQIREKQNEMKIKEEKLKQLAEFNAKVNESYPSAKRQWDECPKREWPSDDWRHGERPQFCQVSGVRLDK